MEVSIYDTINSDLAINQEDGVKVFEAISSIIPSELTISFINVRRISSAFLNECIGLYTQKYSSSIDAIKFIYPTDNSMFQHKVEDVIENALMGDAYDTLVDNALLSL